MTRSERQRRQMPGVQKRSAGFTLLEVLLAFVIFALSFAVVLEIIAGSMRSTVRARDYSEVALFAQSVIESVGQEIPLEAGAFGGETDDGYVWTVEISDFEGVGDDVRTVELAELTNARLYWVDLDIAWGEGRRARDIRFTTIRSRLAAE